ncbi:hypothetical protein Tco_1172256 [Tanacetum coccineum]
MEASRVCQADKHDKERESLVPHMLIGKKCMRNWRGLRDRVNVHTAQHACMVSELRLRYKHENEVRERFEKKFVKSAKTIQQRDAEIASLRSNYRS